MAVKKPKTNQDILDELSQSETFQNITGGAPLKYKDPVFAGAPFTGPTSGIEDTKEAPLPTPQRSNEPSGAEAEFERRFGKPFSELNTEELQKAIEREKVRLAGNGPITRQIEEEAMNNVLKNQFPEASELELQRQRAEDVISAQAREQQASGEMQGTSVEGVETPQVKIGGSILTEEEVAMGLYSGSVTPVTADDLFTVATLGGGLLSLGTKGATTVVTQTAAKSTLKKAGAGVLTKAISLVKGRLFGPFVGALTGGVVAVVAKEILEGGAQDRKGAINTYGQLSRDVVDSAKFSALTPEQADSELDALESEINRLESEIKSSFITRKYLEIKGEMDDINADIIDARKQIRDARAEILTVQIQDPDSVELAYWIQSMQKKYDVKVNKGTIKGDILKIQSD